MSHDLTARVANIFILAVIGVLIPVEFMQFFIPETPAMVHISNFILLISFVLLLKLLRAGQVTLVSLLGIGMCGAIMVLDTVTNERPLTTTNLLGFSLMVCSALALNRKGLILSAAVVASALLIGLLVWQTRVVSEANQRELIQNFIGYTVEFGFVTVVSFIMIGQIHDVHSRMAHTDQQLIDRNTRLEREMVERQRAEQREQRKMVLLRAAIHASNELVGLDSMDELWRCAVELAREQLGIERCIVFVRNEQSGEVWGTFGTNVLGHTTDERAFFSAGMTEFWNSELRTQWVENPWVFVPRMALNQLASDGVSDEQVGEGWVTYTSIASHDGIPFAVMCNDTAISHAPMDEGQQDALAVYCSIVGHLAERKLLEIKMRQQAMQQAAVSERNKLARDLHDSVSQVLFGVVMGAKTARQMITVSPEKAVQPLDYVVQMSEAALAELRALIFELRPESLEQDGLRGALHKQMTALLLRHQIGVELDLGQVEPPISIEAKEALYRIGIEALQNSIRPLRPPRSISCCG